MSLPVWRAFFRSKSTKHGEGNLALHGAQVSVRSAPSPKDLRSAADRLTEPGGAL